MILLNDIHQLFKNKADYRSFLLAYAKIANSLMYQREESIHEITTYLKEQIIEQAKLSPIYNDDRIVTKFDLLDKPKWYIKGFESIENETSGSTGEPFRYLIWKDIYQIIENDNHYKAIADEFGIIGPINILYLHHDTIHPYSTEIAETYTTNNPLISHGLRKQATIHNVITNKRFYLNYYQYYEDIIKYATENKIDIIHAQGNTIAALVWNVKRLRWKKRICRLLSNTGSKLNKQDAIELQQNGNIAAWCDHMRCWDGGVTFFSCRYNTYHLLDNLAWAYTDGGRLISYDYFSLPSPFVNYWNGDYAEIANDYERCQCGRAFRRFEIRRTRSKISQISEVPAIQNAIADNLRTGIKRIEVVRKFMRIFTKHSLPFDQRQSITSLFPNVEIQFTVEEDGQ